MIKCIPNKFYRTGLFDYGEYIASHDWKLQVNYSKRGREQTWICADCEEIRITPAGTIDFSFGCSMVSVKEADKDES